MILLISVEVSPDDGINEYDGRNRLKIDWMELSMLVLPLKEILEI